jgi:peptidoglycan/xylan/chitin deacetylase (PgdA/CDA1 family)
LSLAQFGHRFLTELVALSGACRVPQNGLRILMYHAVGGRADNDHLGYYNITAERFARHMEILNQTAGLTVSPVTQAACEADSAKVAITFDDGYRDNLRVAAPILLARGMPFAVFVATRFVRDRHPDFLSPEEVRELAALPGATIGAHGDTHVPLAGCDDHSLARELADSRAYLEDLTGRAVTTMSYPHGSVDRRVRDAVEAAGYDHAGCSHIGINRSTCDPLLLARTTIFAQDGERYLRRKLAGCWDWYGRLQPQPVGMRVP